MDNEKKLRGSITFECPSCSSPNSVYDIGRFKYIHSGARDIWTCRICGEDAETDDFRVYEFVEN